MAEDCCLRLYQLPAFSFSKGIVVSVKDNTGKSSIYANLDTKMVWDGPLVVLVKPRLRFSCGIVAQTLQDYGRAISIGMPNLWQRDLSNLHPGSANFGKVNPKGNIKSPEAVITPFQVKALS